MKLFAWTLILCAPLSLRAQSHSLSKLWETDTVVAIPESVALDTNTAKRVMYVSLIDGGGRYADGKGGVYLSDSKAGKLYRIENGFNSKTVAAYRLINNNGVRIGSSRRENAAGSQAPALLLWDGGRLDAWHKKAIAGDTTALNLIGQLRAEADKLLAMQPLSVMDKGSTPVSGSKHDYMSQAPYFWPDSTKPNGLPYVNRDGQRNPEIRKITDHDNLAELGNAVQALSLCWYLTRESKYAEKAAALLRHWFLDTATKMNPNLEYGQAIPGINNGRGIGIIETIPLIGIADAARLLEGSASWPSDQVLALQNWYAQYLHWMLTSKNGMDEHAATNNHGTWYLAQAVDIALFTGDTAEARTLAEEGKAKIEHQIAADGKMDRELARTNALHYSTYNLRAFFILARLSSQVGVDLWGFTNSQHAGIRTAFDWLIPYALGRRKWEYQEISGYNKDDFYPLLLQAYDIYNDPAYLTAAKRIHSYRGNAQTELSWGL